VKTAIQVYLHEKALTLSTTNRYVIVSPGSVGHCVTPSVPSIHGVPICKKNTHADYNVEMIFSKSQKIQKEENFGKKIIGRHCHI
jgi:hypothetical protein